MSARTHDRKPEGAEPVVSADVPARRGRRVARPGRAWFVGIGVAAVGVAVVWLLSESGALRFVVRLYQDREFLRDVLQHLGALAPVLFVLIQALQVVIAPIPGEVTGFLGGYLFGEMLGFIYSMIGLTAGSLFAFIVARWLGAPFVRRVVTTQMWDRVGFLVKAEGAILCFIVFLIPGLPKDIACYLFGLSPIPFGVFAVVSTLGRVPGTWALSAEGAKTATGEYVELAILTAVVIAVALPLYYFRDRIVSRFHRTRRAR